MSTEITEADLYVLCKNNVVITFNAVPEGIRVDMPAMPSEEDEQHVLRIIDKLTARVGIGQAVSLAHGKVVPTRTVKGSGTGGDAGSDKGKFH